MPYKDKEQEKEYHRRHYQKNREARLARQIKLDAAKRAFRNSILNQFPCAFCGETDSDLIDWHHINPEEKLFNISQFNTEHSVWWDEVMKCIPLCAMCHRKLHKNKLCLLPHKPKTKN